METLEVRLFGGPKENIGRVQIRYGPDGPWVPVCSRNNSQLSEANSWGKREITVVCKSLGYRAGWYREYGRPHILEMFAAHVQCDGSKY